jgi:transcriptional regulator of acetoin/glycerol metabolism
MSWYSEHKELLVKGGVGDILKDGYVRMEVTVVKKIKVTPRNDIIMRKRSKLYYGNTKFSDAQIVYFFIKHNGIGFRAAKDLGMSPAGFLERLGKLNLISAGINIGKFTKDEVKNAVEKANGYRGKAALILNCSRQHFIKLCKGFNIDTKIESATKKGITDEQFKAALKKAEGNITQTALILNIGKDGVYERLKKLKKRR